MNRNKFHHVYGPVPSRRLGRSLGVDLVPFKTCSYDCVYCQLGKTSKKTIDRKEYVAIDNVLEEVERKLRFEAFPDYISLAGSGEPTLNRGIGRLIHRIKRLTTVPIAVLTNGSLLWMPEVQESLLEADIVLPSLDAGDEVSFRYVNRPHKSISFETMVEGIRKFTAEFSGAVWLEVFLLGGVTGVSSAVKKIASLVNEIGPERVQLNTVSRPPAEEFAFAVNAERMQEFKKLIPGKVELITENGLGKLAITNQQEANNSDILALLSRRPCTVQGVSVGLGINPGEAAKRLQRLNQQGNIKVVHSNDMIFYEKVGLR
jgi:wyosine [tRNA(Phe)-imidazoG37] synthetase (radical SAM superfamily)